MSNLDAVTKVANQLITRLFDQRQCTNGQINYLFKELAENSDFEGNFDRILKINENVCVIDDKYNDNMNKANDSVAHEVNEKVNNLVERTERLLASEATHRDNFNQIIGEKRGELKKKIDNCSMDCNMKLEKLQESIVAEHLELERKYLKFEENLRNK